MEKKTFWKYNTGMSTFIELSYIVTLLIGVACFTVHMTVRAKNLTSVSPLMKWKSTTAFLVFVMLMNVCDFLIVYLTELVGKEGVAWVYIAENVLVILLSYAMIHMGREYAAVQIPKWLNAVFVIVTMTVLYLDCSFTLKVGMAREGFYITSMVVTNMIPVCLLCFFGYRYYKIGHLLRNHRATDSYMKIYYMFVILICVVSIATIIDSLTVNDLILCDEEIYVMFWIVFNVINFTFVWQSCVVDERDEIERLQTTEERMDRIAREYGLSAREREIAELIFRGKNNKEIASVLYLSPNTVKVHASNLYRKLGAINRVQAAAVLRGEEISHSIQTETEEE